MNKYSPIIITLCIGILVGGGLSLFMSNIFINNDMTSNESSEKSNEPLYWVAPMDANFRRDKAGLSPMGMALVPVYASEPDNSAVDNGAGVVSISPNIVNNLGVKTAPVTYGSLVQQIRTTGVVAFNEDNRAAIHARVDGWIEKLHVKAVGDTVKKGQPLYELYSPELVNAQEELILAVEQRNKRLIEAATRKLAILLVPEAVISHIKKTGKLRNQITINAPISGVITSIAVKEGSFIKPATNLLTLSALDTVWVNVDVMESQAALVDLATTAVIDISAYPEKKWQGQVDTIYPLLNEKTRTLQLKIPVNNQDNLLTPNMYSNVTLTTKPALETLLIPNEAVIRTGRNNRVVIALGDGKFKSVEVKIGHNNASITQVLSGLEVGDNVVTSAQFLLDSESNITSDLKRYSHHEQPVIMTMNKVWVKATVNRIMNAHEMINVSHEAITAWDWPSMTMDFYVDESVPIDTFKIGQTFNIEIIKDSDGDYVITAVKVLSDTDSMMKRNMGNNP